MKPSPTAISTLFSGVYETIYKTHNILKCECGSDFFTIKSNRYAYCKCGKYYCLDNLTNQTETTNKIGIDRI